MKLGTGCTMIEVSQALGYFANPLMLSRLVNHPNLNKWSRVKPVPYTGPSYDNVSDLEAFMDLNGWGIEMDSVGVLNTDELMYGSALTLSKGECWHYSGFTPSQSYPARLGDFRHYNTDAECPYLPVELSYYVPGVDGHYGPVMELTWRRNLSQNAEINPYLKSTLHGKYYVVYRKKGETSANSAVTTTVTEGFSAMTSERIQLSSGQTGDYEACALIKRGGGDGELYPLPETYLSYNLRNYSEEEYVGLSFTNLCSLTKRTNTQGTLVVKLQLRNLTNDAIDARVGCVVYDNRGYGNGQTPLWQSYDYSVNVPAGGVVILYGTDGQSFTTTYTEIDVENISSSGDVRPPVYAEGRAKNYYKGDVTIVKTATILDS